MSYTSKITLDGNEYLLKNSYRALVQFETMTGRNAFEASANLTDTSLIFYCVLSSGNRDTFPFTYDDFIDMLDRNENALEQFQNFMEKLIENKLEKAVKETPGNVERR